jgi:hypothetical protein
MPPQGGAAPCCGSSRPDETVLTAENCANEDRHLIGHDELHGLQKHLSEWLEPCMIFLQQEGRSELAPRGGDAAPATGAKGPVLSGAAAEGLLNQIRGAHDALRDIAAMKILELDAANICEASPGVAILRMSVEAGEVKCAWMDLSEVGALRESDFLSTALIGKP